MEAAPPQPTHGRKLVGRRRPSMDLFGDLAATAPDFSGQAEMSVVVAPHLDFGMGSEDHEAGGLCCVE